MESNNNTQTATQRRNIREERLNNKLSRAKDPNAMIVTARTRRITTLINLLSQTDIGIGRLQNSVGENISLEDAKAVFDEFRDIVILVDDFTKKVLNLTNGRYFELAVIKSLRKVADDTVADAKEEVKQKGAKK